MEFVGSGRFPDVGQSALYFRVMSEGRRFLSNRKKQENLVDISSLNSSHNTYQ